MDRQHRRCETCRSAGRERTEEGRVECTAFLDDHPPYDRCGFWKDGGPEDGRD